MGFHSFNKTGFNLYKINFYGDYDRKMNSLQFLLSAKSQEQFLKLSIFPMLRIIAPEPLH